MAEAINLPTSSSNRNTQRSTPRRLVLILIVALIAAIPASLGLGAASASAFQSVSLNVDKPHQLLGGTATLTASTLSDVGPTPWYIQIYDLTSGHLLASCGSGTSCVGHDSYNYPTTHTYVAYISGYSATPPPPNIQYTSSRVDVTWGSPLVLNASPTELQGGRFSTVTASASYDVGPTPYYIEIFDQNTGARIAVCGTGTTCSSAVTYNYSTVHSYVAYIAGNLATLPPPSIQATSNSVSVHWYVIA